LLFTATLTSRACVRRILEIPLSVGLTDPAAASSNRLLQLPWDSRHFGVSMGRIKAEALDPGQASLALKNAHAGKLDLLEAFCRLEDEVSIRTLEDAGFCFSGIKAYLSKRVGQTPDTQSVMLLETAEESDIPLLERTFGELYTDSRYYCYPGLEPERISSLYKVWIAKAVRGYHDDLCLIMRSGEEPVGMCTLRLKEQIGRIGLLGINPMHRREGFGLLLLALAEGWLRRASIRDIATATQGKNMAAIRLYERAGFAVTAFEMSYVKRLS
jgi:ribosomal protein S18 acetylase RimI-like enzyme